MTEKNRIELLVVEFSHLLALVGFAIAQPIYDVLGQYPAFFAAHKVDSVTIVGLTLVLSVGIALVIIGVEAIALLLGRRSRVAVHLLAVLVLSSLVLAPIGKRIFVDSGGLGPGVLDVLQDKLGKRRVIGLDNSSKAVYDRDRGENKHYKILKEDMYSHCLMLMETGRLQLISDLDLLRSLKSITFEYTADKKIKIFGKYSLLAEALVRACWCLKNRGHDLWIA